MKTDYQNKHFERINYRFIPSSSNMVIRVYSLPDWLSSLDESSIHVLAIEYTPRGLLLLSMPRKLNVVFRLYNIPV